MQASQLPLPVPESVLSQVWLEGWLASELRLTDGRRLSVVYRGIWTHANGPDFSGALLEIGGRLRRGAVELHVRASDWRAHGHHLDAAYDAVALHVVLIDDLGHSVSGPSNQAIPTLELRFFLPGPLEEFTRNRRPIDLGSLGARECLPTVAERHPEMIHSILKRKGWERLAAKQLRFSQSLALLPAGEALYLGLLDGLGLSHNREGMALVAEQLPLALLERLLQQGGRDAALAALLGVGGFLPLSPAHAGLIDSPAGAGEIEAVFDSLAREYALEPVSHGVWRLNRVRPMNHPVSRLASLADLVARSGDGLLATFLALPVDDGKPWLAWLSESRPGIGEARGSQIAVNVLAPFLAAYAEVLEDADLGEEAAALWERLPGTVSDSVARRTRRQIVGERHFPIRLAIEEQGLHQIGRFGCAELRCFECPVAALAVEHETRPGTTPQSSA